MGILNWFPEDLALLTSHFHKGSPYLASFPASERAVFTGPPASLPYVFSARTQGRNWFLSGVTHL